MRKAARILNEGRRSKIGEASYFGKIGLLRIGQHMIENTRVEWRVSGEEDTVKRDHRSSSNGQEKR